MRNSKNEKWKPIEDFEGYLISDKGRVMNSKTGRILKPSDNGFGYYQVSLSKNGQRTMKRVSRLVGEAFIDNPNELETINHIDENKHNNKVDNLEWLSRGDNVRYSLSKPVEQYDLFDGELLATYPSTKAVERLTGFDSANVSKACRGQYKKAYGYIWNMQIIKTK